VTRTYFLTGALGCIGAWVVERTLARGDQPVVFDLGGDPRRIRDLVGDEGLARVRFARGDIADLDALRRALAQSGARHVIHLAGLQVPFCKADPAQGARVNVLGTVSVFQAASELGCERVAYASSAAVYGADDAGDGGAAPDERTVGHPTTHYGVYKQANEGNARVFWADSGLSSVGLRPLTVYGVGRDQGLTSDPTRALKAAVVGRRFQIRFSGATDFLWARDCAEAFLAAADRAAPGAHVFNLHGESVDVQRWMELAAREEPRASELIAIAGPRLPIPPAIDGAALEAALQGLERTPLEVGLRETVAHFRRLRDAGRLDTRDLEA
jgi:nucleoside-diphosphate-sugar epimerase